MQVTVELQDMFSYSMVPVYIIVPLLVAAFVAFFLMKRKRTKKEKVPQIKTVQPLNIFAVKAKYNQILMDIERSYSEKKITGRVAYQELSKVIRHFVYEVTGIKVHRFTLTEIQNANMPQLSALIAECYAPEFAVENYSNVLDSIKRARKVIEEWN